LASPAESLRIERVIAVARVCLTAFALASVNLSAAAPRGYAPVAYVLLILYTAHSLSALLVLRRRQRTTSAFALTTHAVDLVAAAITLPLADPANSFFAFFLFVLATAAFRWGFRETVATTAAAILLVVLHARLTATVPELTLGGSFQSDRVILRATYLALMGLLLGYLAEEGRLLRSEMSATVGLLSRIKVDAGLTKTLESVSSEVLGLFNASTLLLVVEDIANHRLLRWDPSNGWSIRPLQEPGDPDESDRARYLFGPPDFSLAIARRRWLRTAASPFKIAALDPIGRRVDADALDVPAAFIVAHPFRRLISAPISLGAEWSGRIFIIDPRLDLRLLALAYFLQTLVQQVGPAVFSVYLLGQLRARAGAIERARVARELHDGVIQSLIGVEMQLEVLRGQDAFRTTLAGSELTRLQGVVHSEVLNLRELMQQMRPAEFDPDELLDHLADMVQRFGRDTGITAHFSADRREVKLPRHVCFELVRIVQEGLVNIRKHSAAANVIVRFGTRTGYWLLEIDDDGRGFPFEGRLGQAELDARRSGPIIIKERVRAIGGELAISSTPGRGSRLEVLVPQEARG
jgi:signal transduction histidine kinase